MNKYFSLSDKVFDVTQRYPELLEWLADNGFANLRNDTMRKLMGSTISLENALRSKKIDLNSAEKQLVAIIENRKAATKMTAEQNGNKTASIRVEGVLPCPIRVQLLEKLDGWVKNKKISVQYELPAASMGLDWLKEKVEKSTADELADVYVSAGFSLFFDRELIAKYTRKGILSDLTNAVKLNSAFDNEEICLRDPLHRYSVIGAVPAVFMVNTDILGERKFPKSWSDLLKPEFENSIALPMQDLDMFNAVLLNIYKEYGKKGVAALGRNLYKGMHPAQMVKAAKQKKKENAPLITIMPYFFTRMIDENAPTKFVWPADGAIISPIFLLAKTGRKKELQPLIDFLFSKELGELFCLGGKFPSMHPQVDNKLSPTQKFMWPGWEFIHTNDISKILRETEDIFNTSAGEKS